MERPNFKIVGKGNTLEDENIVNSSLNEKKEIRKKPFTRELEKNEQEKLIIDGIDNILSREFSSLGLDSIDFSQESVHIVSIDEDKYIGTGEGAAYFPGTQQVIMRRNEVGFIDSVKNSVLNRFKKENIKIKNNYSFLRALLHEAIHAAGHHKFNYDKEKGLDDVDFYRIGYNIRNDKGETSFVGFNEAVVDKMTLELLEKNNEYIGEELMISEQDKHDADLVTGYPWNVNLLNLIIEKISDRDDDENNNPWEKIKKGHFTGNMMFLRSIEERFGEGSLRLLSVMHNIDKDTIPFKDEIWTYFNTDDDGLKKDILEKVLSR